jgi:hypothetical protein
VILRHAPCPECRKNGKDRSGNNLGVYSDHVYCFSCGFWKGKSSFTRKKPVAGTVLAQQSKGLSLPDDSTLSLPPCAYNWLTKYITGKEIRDNRFVWSDKGIPFGTNMYSECLIMPVYDPYGNLLLYQARHFGGDDSLPKYFTKGRPDEVLHILGKNEGPVVLVEDLISAIKVSRVQRSMPLFGSNLSLSTCGRLATITDSLIIWLDNDKLREAHRLARRYSTFFTSIEVISTTSDPKETEPDVVLSSREVFPSRSQSQNSLEYGIQTCREKDSSYLR